MSFHELQSLCTSSVLFHSFSFLQYFLDFFFFFFLCSFPLAAVILAKLQGNPALARNPGLRAKSLLRGSCVGLCSSRHS